MGLRCIGNRVPTLDVRRAKLPPKEVEPYYLTPAHKEWRRQVIKQSGGRCEDCGRTGVRLFADHVIELKDGGDPLGQGRALCQSCHGLKTAAERNKRLSSGPPS